MRALFRYAPTAALFFAAVACSSAGRSGGAPLLPMVLESIARKTPDLSRGFQQLFAFQSAAQGEYPISGLMLDASGNIFGVTQYDGAENCGTLFEIAPVKGLYTETVLHNFSDSVDGCDPYGAPVPDPTSGDLFVTTSQGGLQESLGTLVKFVPISGGYQESALYSFQDASGGFPHGRVAVIGSEVYAVATQAGVKGLGSIVGLTKRSLQQNLVYQFTGPNGGYPVAGLIAGSSGDLYGTTTAGGAFNDGIVFKFTPNKSGGSESILWSFGATPSDGIGPLSDPLLIDESGNIYGTTSAGGIYNQGTVFRLSPSGSAYTETILHSFGGSFDGSEPEAGLARVRNELWGTTVYGGGKPCACGTIFSMSMKGANYRRRLSFQGPRNGSQPYGGLVWDGRALYGPTLLGGSSSDAGSIFRYVP